MASTGKRLHEKVTVVVGAGQTPGEGIGNGRATALLFAREGAKVVLVDHDLESARETGRMIDQELGDDPPRWRAMQANVLSEEDCQSVVESTIEIFGRIDVLHYNVGIGRAGDRELTKLEQGEWDLIHDVNLKGAYLFCKHVVPVMRQQASGVITCISSVASIAATPMVAYKTSKAGLNALVQSVASQNAKYGIRCNAILPGMLDTPMAIAGQSKALGIDPEELRKTRDTFVPLKGRRGTGWDTAYAALFLASDEAGYITGVQLPVDGGRSACLGGPA
jgi:NAD(P)-dependent dehydrogenase (short-subunit alcohol dehydrogenase family)